MRTTSLLVTAALLSAQATALAQPGASPPPPPPPPNYYPPQSYQPPPQGLTQEEQELLAEGEISDGAHVGGALLSIFIGFGSGQAVQGRWGDTGWIFTLGEVASIALIIYGVEQEATQDWCDGFDEPECSEDPGALPITVGLIGFVVLHVWEVVDAIAGPARHNRRVRNLRMRMGYPPAGYYYGQVEPYVTPVGKNDDDGAIAGIRVRF